MKKYFFSILVRVFLALSGFLVFLISARLFGPDGRGLISYGTSLFAFIALIFSFNFGRSFIDKTKQNNHLKNQLLPRYLNLNLLSTLATICVGITYWHFSVAAQKMIAPEQIVLFSLISFFYVWSINGNYFYAAFLKTYYQEFIIATTRFILIVFLILFLLFGHSLDHFIMYYVMILTLGVVAEIATLYMITETNTQQPHKHQIFDESVFINHFDYLSFNLFPLALIIISGYFLEKAEIGRINFAIQIINLIFLFSTTANIKVNSYISDVGFRSRIPQLKKLFFGTLILSLGSAFFIYYILSHQLFLHNLGSFTGAEKYFLLSIFSIPGYIIYQFLSPILLEIKKVKISCLLNSITFIIFSVISFYIIPEFGAASVLYLFSGFYLTLFACQSMIIIKYLHQHSSKNSTQRHLKLVKH